MDPRITDDGQIFLLRGPDHSDLRLDGDPRCMTVLLRLLDGSKTVLELSSALAEHGFAVEPQELREAIEMLSQAGVVDDASIDDQLLGRYEVERYQRQLAYFADLDADRPAAAVQRRLLDSTVCLLGLGGIGSWVAWALAAAGVGRLIGVDRDEVELSNLNRQILFGHDDLGRPKAEAAGSPLGRFSPRLEYEPVNCELNSAAAMEEVIRGADLVVSSVDWPPHRVERWVNEACFRVGIPYITASQHPPLVRSGPLFVPGETACAQCRDDSYRERYPLYSILEAAEQPVAPSATFGPACGVVGTLVANDALAYLSGLNEPATLSRALQLDLRTGETTVEPVGRRADCSVCADH